ncbi:histidine kinase [Hazenella sp. IB182353]|uniref:sensor histidine kinase n=1 Tax=Polycladospora coralii TaxID=2771432 RepID=UPI0017473052|nr:histidine kinase [Polycladospora coralii]MBS7531894.1 histidine kinase [Polycladospora coralii]
MIRTIRGKILLLVSCIVLLYSLYGFTFFFIHQQQIKQYNEVLERFLLLQRISSQSEQLLQVSRSYLNTPDPARKRRYETIKKSLLEDYEKLHIFQHNSNQIHLIDYMNQMKEQMELIHSALLSHEHQLFANAEDYYNRATQVQHLLNETTFTLIQAELIENKAYYAKMIQLSKQFQQDTLLGLLLAVCVLFFLAYLLATNITRSIRTLATGAKRIATGNYQSPIHVQTKDETAFLADTFNTMQENIQAAFDKLKQRMHLEQELQEYQLLAKEVELDRLQSQIKPHFLFNTLNLLAKKAYLEHAHETSDLVITVAQLLRYQMQDPRSGVSLAQEMDMIRNYCAILKARFTHRLHIFIDATEPVLQSIKIPSFTLQPLVENAFQHGIEPKETGGTIRISIEVKTNDVYVYIRDDGLGMSMTQLESGGMGIYNVKRRLQLFYQRQDVLQITSQINKGTTIKLSLPREPSKVITNDSNPSC